ncbi:MAG: hypothetical protein ACPG21_14160 [Crocinitomicaceae bacterium]
MTQKIVNLLLFFLAIPLFAQESPDVILTTGHNDQVNAMRVTKDGRFLASDEWNNGLFTYVFLRGLKVENDDNKVYLSEIREYVNQGVQKLSKGKQIPTAREENISRDYIIFGN